MTNPSSFVPSAFDGALWTHIRPLVEALKARPVASAADLERWLLDRSDLEAACSEARANLYIATSCNTDDQAISAAYTRYLEEVGPKLEVAAFELDRKQVDLHARYPLSRERYEVLERSKRASVELFREENVPIQTELAKLSQDYGKITGAQTVQFEGQERTLPQMTQYLQRPDRAVREAAWKGITERRLKDRGALDDLLDQMVHRRDAMARNAGCASYVEFAFREKQRFDYTPEDCRTFWGAVERHVVPLVRRLDSRRKQSLGVDELRPWDLGVDVKGRAGLRPFDGGRELMAKTQSVMDVLDPRLGAMTRRLGGTPSNGQGSPDKALVTDCLDLDSRKGKRPGGYQYVRDFSRRPFIFMNAAGLHRDVMTMVHEAGHAFHSMLAEGDPLVDYRHSPIEFAEVASMSMEHLTMPHWGGKGGRAGFYDKDEDLRRARREHLEDSISILAWIATIDSFQHWMYRNPAHTHAQRDAFWLSLDERFGHAVSWRTHEAARESQWQRQGHLYSHPMYYIEYGIAQLGALGLWLKSRKEGERAAVDAYVRALTMGGSRPLPQLFQAAGLTFEFGEKPVAAVVEAVEGELANLGD